MYKILYVDDESSLLEIGKTFLERDRTFAVDTSLSAVDALGHLKSIQYDAIVSDYQMPEMDGITFLKKYAPAEIPRPSSSSPGKGVRKLSSMHSIMGQIFIFRKGVLQKPSLPN